MTAGRRAPRCGGSPAGRFHPTAASAMVSRSKNSSAPPAGEPAITCATFMPDRIYHFLRAARAKAHSFPMTRLAALPERGVIEVGGEDRVTFLQGLVSNDVAAGDAWPRGLGGPADAAGQVARRLLHPGGRRPSAARLRACADAAAAAAAVALSPAVQGDAACGRRTVRLRRLERRADIGGDHRDRPTPAGCGLAHAVRDAVCRRPHSRRTGIVTGWRSACPMARATWRRRRRCCWRPASTS